jgi:hypothetical protein
MWGLWWTKWHWYRFFSEYFGFPLSISFHRCSITRKRTKNNNHRHLHHRVAQEASRLRCVRSVCCGALHHKKNPLNTYIVQCFILYRTCFGSNGAIITKYNNYGYRHTPRLRNTYGFSTARAVTRTRLNVTLYVDCQSCYISILKCLMLW